MLYICRKIALLTAGGTKDFADALAPFGLDPTSSTFWTDALTAHLGELVKPRNLDISSEEKKTVGKYLPTYFLGVVLGMKKFTFAEKSFIFRPRASKNSEEL